MPPVIAAVQNRRAAAVLRSGAPVGVSSLTRALTGAVIATEATPPFLGFGWAYVQDSQYTQASPLAVGAGQAQQITIDGLGASTDSSYLRAPFAGWQFWHGDRFWPYSVGDDYTLRLDFSAQSLAINNAVRATLDIGSAAGPTFDDYQPFGVAAGVQRNFRFDIPLFDKTTFVTNGATISVAPDTPMTIWSIGLYIAPGSIGTPR